MRRVGLALLLVVVGAAVAQAGLVRTTDGAVASDAADVRAWILARRIDNPGAPGHGAVRVHADPGHHGGGTAWHQVVPYFAHQGLLGYVRSTDAGRFGVTWDYVVWYLGHNETDGRVLNHWYNADGSVQRTCPPEVEAGDPQNKCSHEDAADSYAATFLTLVRAYHEEGGGTARFNDTGVQAGLERVAGLLAGLVDPADNLTWNLKPGPRPRTKYLLDNAETVEGLRAAAYLEAVVYGNATKAAAYDGLAAAVQQAVRDELFLPALGAYAVGKAEGAAAADPPDPAVWYWSGPQQAWPVLTGAAAPGDAETAQAWAALDLWWGVGARDWSHNTVDPTGQLWAGVGWAAHAAGRDAEARTHAEFVRCRTAAADPVEPGFAWPFHVGDAGLLLQSLDAGLALPDGAFLCLPRGAGLWLPAP